MSIREQIVDTLENKGSLSALELSIILDRTVADIRYQMRNLTAENLVFKKSPLPNDSPGRPASVYTLSDAAPEKLYRQVVKVLLASLNQSMNVITLSDRVTEALAADFNPNGSPTNRMDQMVVYLSNLGIFSRWEAHKTGPKIIIVKETLTSLLNDKKLSNTILKNVIYRLKEKAVGESPTA